MNSPVNGVYTTVAVDDEMRIEKNAGLIMAVGQLLVFLEFPFHAERATKYSRLTDGLCGYLIPNPCSFELIVLLSLLIR